MRQHLAKLAPAVLVGGCSLIYNPNDIDRARIDAPIDMPQEEVVDMEMRADAMPRDLMITEAFPAAILEGSDVEDLDMSCFDGRYITGTVTDEYLAWVEGSQES